MTQKEYWDSVSEKKEFTTPFQAEEFSKYVHKDSLIVDIGCGYGRTLNELSGFEFKNLIEFDFSDEMIERGKRQFPGLDLRVKKNELVDMPDESVDAVILFAVLTCIYKDEEQKKLISEIRRILKSGGVLYVNDFLLNTDDRNLDRYRKFENEFGVFGVFELLEGAIVRHHSEESIKELLGDFAEKEYSNLTFTTMNGHTSNGFFFIGAK